MYLPISFATWLPAWRGTFCWSTSFPRHIYYSRTICIQYSQELLFLFSSFQIANETSRVFLISPSLWLLVCATGPAQARARAADNSIVYGISNLQGQTAEARNSFHFHRTLRPPAILNCKLFAVFLYMSIMLLYTQYSVQIYNKNCIFIKNRSDRLQLCFGSNPSFKKRVFIFQLTVLGF